MKKVVVLASAAVVLLTSCNSGSSNETPASEKKEDGATAVSADWISLFDGQSTKGWHQYGKSSVSDIWNVSPDRQI